MEKEIFAEQYMVFMSIFPKSIVNIVKIRTFWHFETLKTVFAGKWLLLGKSQPFVGLIPGYGFFYSFIEQVFRFVSKVFP